MFRCPTEKIPSNGCFGNPIMPSVTRTGLSRWKSVPLDSLIQFRENVQTRPIQVNIMDWTRFPWKNTKTKIKIKWNELVSDVVFDFFQAMSMKFANRIRKPSYERWITVPSTLTVPCVTLNMEVICRNAAILICFLPYPWNVKTSRPSLVITEPSPKHHVSPAIIIKLTCHITLQDLQTSPGCLSCLYSLW